MSSIAERYQAFRASTPAQTIELQNVRWRWFEAGTGSPALVALPGAIGGGDIFFLLVQELAASTRVLAVDLPFFTTAEEAISGLDRFLESRDVVSAVLLGASFSGLLVQAYARCYPDRTAALILSHTGMLDPARAARTRRYANRVGRIPASVVRALLRLLVLAMTRKMGDERRFWRDLYARALAGLTREEAMSRYELASALDAGDASSKWDGPVLIVHSDDDPIAKPDEGERLRTAYRHAIFKEFRGTGHSSYSTRPLEYAAVVRQFVATVRARADVP